MKIQGTISLVTLVAVIFSAGRIFQKVEDIDRRLAAVEGVLLPKKAEHTKDSAPSVQYVKYSGKACVLPLDGASANLPAL